MRAVNKARKKMTDLLEKDLAGFGEAYDEDRFPIAMAYVRWQKLDEMYEPEKALCKGTLFPELHKPFCGRTVTGGCK